MAAPSSTTSTEKEERSEEVTESANVPSNKKAFIPLENNPEVMSSLIYKLGVSPKLAFHDVFSIDDPDLLAFVPRPAYALLLVFPVSETYERFRREEDGPIDEYQGSGPNEDVLWFKQTIRNACGLIGLLHGVTNGEARKFIAPSSALSDLVSSALPLKPDGRAQLLYQSSALESAHQAAAVKGDTVAPAAEENVDLHYVCFVKSSTTNHLWELDGRRKGPIDRGLLPDPDDDVLSPEALELTIRPFLKRGGGAGANPGGDGGDGGDDDAAAAAAELRFSLVVLAPALE